MAVIFIILLIVAFFWMASLRAKQYEENIKHKKLYEDYKEKYDELNNNLENYKNELKELYLEEKRKLDAEINNYKHETLLISVERSELNNYLSYIKNTYPSVFDTIEELSDDSEKTPVEKTGWLTKEEYNTLSELEKNTLAFERYKKNRHSKWQLGRDFEMSVGYRYEQNGYKVEYFGMQNGKRDLGRDLIASMNNEVYIIQCKYWSTKKTIHENHLCQLYGTTVMYELEHPDKKVYPVFICHNTLSDTAKRFADRLGIIVKENIDMSDYPAIKLNIDKYEKIYFLPFDLNYDSLKKYDVVMTVKDAEDRGYRRRYRWHP